MLIYIPEFFLSLSDHFIQLVHYVIEYLQLTVQQLISYQNYYFMQISQRAVPYQKSSSIPRTDSQRDPLRRTYFRLRQIKQTTQQIPSPIRTPPRRHNDFYSHQQAAIQQVKAQKIKLKQLRQKNVKEVRQKKLSNTASNFYHNMSKMGKGSSSIEKDRESTPLRKTFYNQRSSESPPKSPQSGLLFGRTSLNFHKQDIWKNENSNNYLNKYQIIKELGKGSFSTVFLARKQAVSKNTQRNCLSPLLNPQKAIREETSGNLDVSMQSPKMGRQQTLSISTHEIQKTSDTLPYLGIQADESDLSRLVAIKVYQKFKMTKDPHKFKNIRKQINIMQNLQNQGVVKLYQSVQTLTKISLVVEYGGEQSLLEYVKHNYPLPLQKVKNISFQLIKALSYLHDKAIVHRDIKLQNILIYKDVIKLIDFGFSCLTHKQQKMTVICGTPNYMAPEVISRKQYIGEQADIWSYGVVVYALAEGRHPFKADTYNQLERIVSRGKFEFKKVHDQVFMDFVRRVLRVKGGDRPSARDIMKMRFFKECEG